jgi:hypothetical protein
MSELLETIEERGFSAVPIELTHGDLNDTIGLYQEFLELPEEFHDATRFFTTKRGDGDFGQFRREAGKQGARGTVPDNKDILHFGADTRQVATTRLGRMPQAMKWLLASCEDIFWSAEATKCCALKELQGDARLVTDVMAPEQGRLNDVLRLICYYDNQDNLAKGHFDRGVATLAIGQSHGGLRLAAGQNGLGASVTKSYLQELDAGLQPVEHREGEAKFFLGAGWHRLPYEYREGLTHLPLGWHDVVKSPKRVDDKVARWAIVMFCNPQLGFEDYVVPSPEETRPHKMFDHS